MNEDGAFYFKEIPETEIEPEKLRAAGRCLEYCRKALGNLPHVVKIKWYAKASKRSFDMDQLFVRLIQNQRRLVQDQTEVKTQYVSRDWDFWGECRITKDDEIAVRTDIPLDATLHTVAHELKHLSDDAPPYNLFGKITKQESEKRADNFAREAMRIIEPDAFKDKGK